MRTGVLLALGVSCSLVGLAQSAPKFEVVSIKPTDAPRGPGFVSGAQFQPGGRFVATNVTVLALINQAFREGDPPFPGIDNAAALPGWVRTQYFNVDARVGDAVVNEKLTNTALGAALIRAMLEDRFKLRAHLENRDVQAYALKLSRANGTLGPNIHRSPDCETLMRERVARGDTPFAPGGPPAAGERRCGAVTNTRPGNTTGTGVSLAFLGTWLSASLRPTPVVDQTGLTGLYDFTLTWADENAVRRGDPPPEGPSIFTALQEQLGLKLESTRQSHAVIVVDHIEPPTPD